MKIDSGSNSLSQHAAPGIVIRPGTEPPRKPTVLAFIWGGKTSPVPAIPYGRKTAA